MAELSAAAKELKAACDKAYDDNQGSCSDAVWDVLRARVNAQEPYRVANALVDYMVGSWRQVTLDDGYELANKGVVVIGGTKKEKGHGHVIVVYPGDKIKNGGYKYYWKKGGKFLVLRATGTYPRALSTSNGSWPGAMSRGDKTVWDPWGSDEAFASVRFWTPPS